MKEEEDKKKGFDQEKKKWEEKGWRGRELIFLDDLC